MEKKSDRKWRYDTDSSWMLSTKFRELQKLDPEKKKPERFFFGQAGSGKSLGKKGMLVYTPNGYGIIQDESDKNQTFIIKIENDQITHKISDVFFFIPLNLMISNQLAGMTKKKIFLQAASNQEQLLAKVAKTMADSEGDNTPEAQVYFKGKEVKKNANPIKNMGISPFATLLVMSAGGGIDSAVLQKKEMRMVKEWLDLGNNVSFELVYSGSRDGYKREQFWNIIEGHENCITFALSDHGCRFGGFRTKKYGSASQYLADKDAFLFSLTHSKKIPQKEGSNERYALYDYSYKLGSWGGGHDLSLCADCNTSNSSYSNLGHTYDPDPLTYNS